jgi:hypothetical protein
MDATIFSAPTRAFLPPILTNIITRISLLFPLLISFLSTIVFESDRNRTARSAVLPTRRGAARRRRALHGVDTALARDGGLDVIGLERKRKWMRVVQWVHEKGGLVWFGLDSDSDGKEGGE